MGVTEELTRANQHYAEQFDRGHLPAPPARRLAVVTCMDARLDPRAFLGLDLGDAHVIRNAGGCVTEDVLRSLIVSSHLLGTNQYLVIHHTDCGMLTFTDEEVREKVTNETGTDASHIDFLCFPDLEQSVRDDITRIVECPFLPEGITVKGFVYDVRTGELTEVPSVSEARTLGTRQTAARPSEPERTTAAGGII